MAAIRARAAVEGDILPVVTLASSARVASPTGVAVDAFSDDELATHLSVYLASGAEMVVAEMDGRLVGFMLMRTVGPHMFAYAPAVIVDSFFVVPPERRKGVGHALLLYAANRADAISAPYIYASPPSADRALQRFLARLGFAPAAGHRVVATPVILRRLHAGDARPSSRGRQRRLAIDDLVAKRKRAREAGLSTGAIDLSSIQDRSPSR